MKRFYWSTLLSLTVILAILVSPVLAAPNGTITASGVVVPAQITELGFMTSALVKEIPVKEGEQVQAGQVLVALDVPELEYGVKAAEEALRSAQGEEKVQNYRRVKDRRNGRTFFDVVPPEIRKIAHAHVLQAEAELAIAQTTLSQTILTAPQAGTVTSIKALPGEYVEQNQPVVTLVTLNNLQIETTDLSERDIAKVRMGAPVNITVKALNKDFTGRVVGISSKADTVGGDVVFKVTIAFDRQPENLLWGMTAEVTIEE